MDEVQRTVAAGMSGFKGVFWEVTSQPVVRFASADCSKFALVVDGIIRTSGGEGAPEARQLSDKFWNFRQYRQPNYHQFSPKTGENTYLPTAGNLPTIGTYPQPET